MTTSAIASARELPHPDVSHLVLTDVLFALSDPSRLAIVRQLAAGPLHEASCQNVGGEIPKSTRSHHLKTLREAGLVDCERRGTFVYYWIQPGALEVLSRLLAVR
jgi:DNA-binding transcriptional ArsR family regulator